VNQDEIKAQLGTNFEQNFVNKETRNYDALSPVQLQVYLKLIGGKQVGTLTADQEAMTELAQLKLTDPNTAWRVQTFYNMREQRYPDFYKLQNQYYSQPEKQRSAWLVKNPELKAYWNDRQKWMNDNPDLVRFLTDDPKQLKKYENKKRQLEKAVPTAQELRSQISQPTQALISDWQKGKSLPANIEKYLASFAKSNGLDFRTMMGILTGQ
jgi:hypothetical protein